MTFRTKVFIAALIIAPVPLFLFIKHFPRSLHFSDPAPRGIHGIYSSANYDRVYKTKLHKDSLLVDLEKEGLIIKSGRLHDYDAPWDSLRYLIDSVTCDTQRIEPYIEFFKEKQNGLTCFKIIWINAAPNLSYDTSVVPILTKKYYDCFEDILKRHEVTKE